MEVKPETVFNLMLTSGGIKELLNETKEIFKDGNLDEKYPILHSLRRILVREYLDL